MMKTVEATDIDFARLFKVGAPVNEWFGRSIKNGRLVKGMAGVIQFDDGRYFGFMEFTKSLYRPMIFRAFKRFMDNMPQKYGVNELFAACDDSIRNSDVFLKRLGFVETDEMLGNLKVWKWQA